MATTKATVGDLARQIQNKAAAGRIKTLLDALVDKVDAVVTGAAGFLTADAGGRAVMATGYFTEAAATDKFAAGAITTGLLKANAVTGAKLDGTLFGVSTRSGAGAVAITAPLCLFTSTGSAQALTVADSTVTGQTLRILHTVDGGSGVITQTTGAKLSSGITTITLTNRFDWVELVWTGALWEVAGYYGATIATS